MNKRYGVPYMGSKNKIAEWVADNLPAAPVLVDLFAGGGAITHRATISGKWGRVMSNDIDGTAMQLYADAVAGKYANETRWISREDFFRLKDSDPYVRWCWSFGTNGEDYMYAVELEPWKMALHMARVFGDMSMLREFGIGGDGSRADVVAHHDEYKEKYIRWWLSKQKYTVKMQQFMPGLVQPYDEVVGLHRLLQRLQRLQSLQNLQNLQRLQGLSMPEISCCDYEMVKLPPSSVCYCDIPYRGTHGYNGAIFDHERFYQWACRQTCLVVISEYDMPCDRFERVAVTHKINQMNGRGPKARVAEGLWVPRHQVELYKQMMMK